MDRPPESRVEKTAAEARQGNIGRQVLKVLIASLFLAFVVWGIVEFFGQSSETNGTIQAPVRPANDEMSPVDNASPPSNWQ
jgi:TRAP-type mannitol/chloroaromatic compound transport system permease large subunit